VIPLRPPGSGPQHHDLERPWWGLGDVAAGVVAAQFLSVAVAVVVYAAAGWSRAGDAPLWVAGLLQIPLWVGLAGSTVWAADRKGLGLREDFGLSMRALDAPLGLVIGVLCQLVLLPVVYWPLLQLLDKDADDLSEPARALSDRAGSPAGWVVLAVMVVVGAPIVEELFYRGLVLRSLEKRGWPQWAGVLGSAGLFALMHFQALQFLGLFLFGVVLGVLALRTGRLGLPMWAHAGFNATTVVLLYATD
jgi:membrane protease YdiL (CAAX protease family)